MKLFLLTAGGSPLKKQMLDDRKFAKMHLNLQRLLQASMFVLYGFLWLITAYHVVLLEEVQK